MVHFNKIINSFMLSQTYIYMDRIWFHLFNLFIIIVQIELKLKHIFCDKALILKHVAVENHILLLLSLSDYKLYINYFNITIAKFKTKNFYNKYNNKFNMYLYIVHHLTFNNNNILFRNLPLFILFQFLNFIHKP